MDADRDVMRDLYYLEAEVDRLRTENERLQSEALKWERMFDAAAFALTRHSEFYKWHELAEMRWEFSWADSPLSKYETWLHPSQLNKGRHG